MLLLPVFHSLVHSSPNLCLASLSSASPLISVPSFVSSGRVWAYHLHGLLSTYMSYYMHVIGVWPSRQSLFHWLSGCRGSILDLTYYYVYLLLCGYVLRVARLSACLWCTIGLCRFMHCPIPMPGVFCQSTLLAF